MKLKVLGCYGGNIPGHGMTSLLINDTLALDAGWVSEALSLKEQEKVKNILISHSHLDHTCTLPFLIDNNFSAPGFSGPSPTITSLASRRFRTSENTLITVGMFLTGLKLEACIRILAWGGASLSPLLRRGAKIRVSTKL